MSQRARPPAERVIRFLIPLLLLLPCLASPAWGAKGGPILIDQKKALQGGVTPGDDPGFPVTITQSGFYQLTGSLDVRVAPDPPNTRAIQVNAEAVTIDLNGFSIIGPVLCSGTPVSSCSDTGSGEGILSFARNTTVRNGTVRGMGFFGVSLNSSHSSVERVEAIGNGGRGISLADFGRVIGCKADANGENGIHVQGGGLVTGSTSGQNNQVGINATGGGGSVVGNTVIGNGHHGIFTGAQALVRSNTVRGNAGFGLQLNPGAGYGDNVIDGNNGGNANPQVGIGVQMGTNVCGGDTTCP
jgi:hypothetical protein